MKEETAKMLYNNIKCEPCNTDPSDVKEAAFKYFTYSANDYKEIGTVENKKEKVVDEQLLQEDNIAHNNYIELSMTLKSTENRLNEALSIIKDYEKEKQNKKETETTLVIYEDKLVKLLLADIGANEHDVDLYDKYHDMIMSCRYINDKQKKENEYSPFLA